MFGIEKHIDAVKGMAKDEFLNYTDSKVKTDTNKVLYYEDHVGYFMADPIKLLSAYSNLNQRMHCADLKGTLYCSRLYDFLKDASRHVN